MEIRNDAFPNPFIDGACADRKPLGELFLFDQRATGGCVCNLLDRVTTVDGGVICCEDGFHNGAWLELSTHRVSCRHDKCLDAFFDCPRHFARLPV